MTVTFRKSQASTEMSTDRRQFLEKTGASLLAFGVPAFAATWATEASGAVAAERTYTPGYYGLELAGQFVGPLRGFSGGYVWAETIKEGPDPTTLVQHKHPGPPRVEAITIQTGLPMGKPLYDWIKSSIEPSPKFPSMDGAIIEYDPMRREIGRRVFSNALITEIGFPACDASSKDLGKLTVSFSAATLNLIAGKGGAAPAFRQTKWVPSAYRLNIQGLESATVRASRIEPLVIKVQAGTSNVGQFRVASPSSTIEIPNLVVTVADTSIGPFYAWLDDFVLRGKSGQENERTGVLEYLSPDLTSVVLRLNFFNLGILKIAPDATAGAQAPRRSKVEMYCEAMTVNF